jgi:hypothetical protein
MEQPWYCNTPGSIFTLDLNEGSGVIMGKSRALHSLALPSRIAEGNGDDRVTARPQPDPIGERSSGVNNNGNGNACLNSTPAILSLKSMNQYTSIRHSTVDNWLALRYSLVMSVY